MTAGVFPSAFVGPCFARELGSTEIKCSVQRAKTNPLLSKVSTELLESSELERFERNGEEKLRPVDEVAPPESPGFLN
jgi:hypothetical protein